MATLPIAVDARAAQRGAQEAADALADVKRGAEASTAATAGFQESLDAVGKTGATALSGIPPALKPISDEFERLRQELLDLRTTLDNSGPVESTTAKWLALTAVYRDNADALAEVKRQNLGMAAGVAYPEQTTAKWLALTDLYRRNADTLDGIRSKTRAVGQESETGFRKMTAGIAEAISMGGGLNTVLLRTARALPGVAAGFFGADLLSRIATGKSLIANLTDGLHDLGKFVGESVTSFLGLGDALEVEFGKGARDAVLTISSLREEFVKLRQEKELTGKVPIGPLTQTIPGFGREFPFDVTGIDRTNLENARDLDAIFQKLQERLKGINSGIVAFAPAIRIAKEDAAIYETIAALDALRERTKEQRAAAEAAAKTSAEWAKALERGAAVSEKIDSNRRMRADLEALGQAGARVVPFFAEIGLAAARYANEAAKAQKATEDFDKALEAGAAMKARQQNIEALSNALTPLAVLFAQASIASAQFAKQLEGADKLFSDTRAGIKAREDAVGSIQDEIRYLQILRKEGERAAQVDRDLQAFKKASSEAGVQLTDLEIQNMKELIAWRERERDLAEQSQRLRELGRDAGQTIANGFEEAVFSGEKLREVIRNLIADLAQLAFNRTVTSQLASLFGGLLGGVGFAAGAGGGGGAPSGVPDLPDTLNATYGGPGGSALAATSSGAKSAGPTVNNYYSVNIQTPDLESFKRSQRQVKASVMAGVGARG